VIFLPDEAGPLSEIVTNKKKADAAQPVLRANSGAGTVASGQVPKPGKKVNKAEIKTGKNGKQAAGEVETKTVVAQQALHAKPQRSMAAAAAHHKALREVQHARKGIIFHNRDLCAIRLVETASFQHYTCTRVCAHTCYIISYSIHTRVCVHTHTTYTH
jgi:hypothetical protein